MYTVSPHSVLKQISEALPADCRDKLHYLAALQRGVAKSRKTIGRFQFS
jgi:hypothetical protein